MIVFTRIAFHCLKQPDAQIILWNSKSALIVVVLANRRLTKFIADLSFPIVLNHLHYRDSMALGACAFRILFASRAGVRLRVSI